MSCEVEERFGPGRLVLVVGPSGAGKDTLIRLARDQVERHGRVVFPRRIVTRQSNPWEDHDTVSPEQFEAGMRSGLYPLHWEAHGLRYALPVSIVTDVAGGRTVVANVSRHAVSSARQRFARVTVAYVTAPPDILAARILQRGRDAAITTRLARAAPGPDLADVVIENAGSPLMSAGRLLEVLQGA